MYYTKKYTLGMYVKHLYYVSSTYKYIKIFFITWINEQIGRIRCTGRYLQCELNNNNNKWTTDGSNSALLFRLACVVQLQNLNLRFYTGRRTFRSYCILLLISYIIFYHTYTLYTRPAVVDVGLFYVYVITSRMIMLYGEKNVCVLWLFYFFFSLLWAAAANASYISPDVKRRETGK